MLAKLNDLFISEIPQEINDKNVLTDLTKTLTCK